MAITNIIEPEKVSLARSPVQVKLTSNLPTTPNLINRLRLTISGSPAVDETITISYGDVSETFVMKTVADQSGNTLSIQGALTLPQYAELLVEELQQNFNLFLNFEIEYSPGAEEYISLSPRANLSLTWTVEETLTNIDADIIDGGAAYQVSPSIVLLAQLYNPDTAQFDILLPHVLPVIESSEEVVFDIHRDFALAPHLPAQSSIGIGGEYIEECVDNWTKYKLSWAERSGSPAQTSALQSSDTEFYAIFGGNDYFHQYDEFWSFHQLNGKFLTAAPRTQTVTYEQPVWLYWIGRTSRITKISGVATHRSGATTPYTRGEISEVQGEVIVLKECDSWTRYFLFANSLGGCDTVRATGKHTTRLNTITQEGSRITTENTASAGQGEDFHYNRRSRVSYEGSVGHKSASYVAYLQDLMNAPAAWLIDLNANRYNPVLIEAGDINLLKDDEDLYTLRFSYAHAWEEAHLGVTDDGQRIIVSEPEDG